MISPSLQFDFPKPLCFTKPRHVLTAISLDEVRPALRAAQAASEAGYYVAGYVAYEAAPAFDPALCTAVHSTALPLVWLGVFSEPSLPAVESEEGMYQLSAWEPDSDYAQYSFAIGAIRDAIATGEVYQVNHTFRLRARLEGDSYAFYRRLQKAQKAKFASYLDLGEFTIVSASPELFFHQTDRHIMTRPMKGTCPRGRWQEEDESLAAALAGSEKDRAENVMIVDLLRNDLGRVAIPGTVQVPRLFEVERYPTVMQMTSTIEANLRPDVDLEDVFGALFPCGSVTGAPKIRASGLIAQLETAPRQIYCGAVGYLTPKQEAVFSVAIRTALLDKKTGLIEYGVGGGIVWDSTAESEHREAWTKAAILIEPAPLFDLLETLRWQDGFYFLLDRHLERLLSSAAYFGFFVDVDAVRETLLAYGKKLGEGAWRVRLCVSAQGKCCLEHTPLLPLTPEARTVALAKAPVSRSDKFLCHKTTYRPVYEARRRDHPQCFDVLLWNEEGELTEFTIGNLMIEHEAQLWTPPRECGLLNGTLRTELLAQGRLQERVLRQEDLKTASHVWLINSVRGLVPVAF